jgi:hypothetical protein
VGCGPLEMTEGGAIVASACVVGVESTACAESCVRSVGEDRTDRRSPRVSMKGCASEWAAPIGRTHQAKREKGKQPHAGEGIGADWAGLLSIERAGARTHEGKRQHARPRW